MICTWEIFFPSHYLGRVCHQPGQREPTALQALCQLLAKGENLYTRGKTTPQHSTASWSLVCPERSQGPTGEDKQWLGVSTSVSEGRACFCKAGGKQEITLCQKWAKGNLFTEQSSARSGKLDLTVKAALKVLCPHKEQNFPGNLNCPKYSSQGLLKLFSVL